MSKTGVSFDRVNYILDRQEEEMAESGVIPGARTLCLIT